MRTRTLSLVLILVVSGIEFAQDKNAEIDFLPTPVCFDGKTVYINTLGNIVLKTDFDYFVFQNNSFSEGLAGFKQNHKYGFIDKSGKVAIKPAFDYAHIFSEGFAEIEINDKKGLIDKTGSIVVQPKYDKTSMFVNGFAAVGIINGSDEEGFLTYKWGFVDKTGKIVVGKTKNSYVGKFDDVDVFSEGVAAIKVGHKWGYVNESDQTVIKSRFDKANSFSEGLAPATIDGKLWGFIDKKGRFVIDPQFDAAEEFSEGLAAVRLDKFKPHDWGFIDKTGKFVIQPTFSFKPGPFANGYSVLFYGSGGFGYSDRTGKVVNKQYIGGASSYHNGVAWVYPNEYGENYIKYGGGYIDENGKYIWNPKEKNQMFGAKCNN